jgi:ferric-dicitrate binding protein FerR (iron transport regulator)
MKNYLFTLSTFAFLLAAMLASPALSQEQSPASALGIIVRSTNAFIGNAATSEGASIYSGDYLSTHENGALQLRIGALSLQLEASSAVHIYRAPYGAVVELNRGSVVYTTPGGNENLVIVGLDVRVTPDTTQPDLGRVTVDDPCEVEVYSQRGQAHVQSGKETKLIEQGKAYHVRAENKISYREYLSPDASDYHRYHEHVPCAAGDVLHTRGPIAPAQSHFIVLAGTVAGIVSTIAVYKGMESPDHP